MGCSVCLGMNWPRDQLSGAVRRVGCCGTLISSGKCFVGWWSVGVVTKQIVSVWDEASFGGPKPDVG